MLGVTVEASVADQTAIPAVVVGTILWAVAFAAIWATQGATQPETGVWWWAVAAIGTCSGAIGLVFLGWRRKRIG